MSLTKSNTDDDNVWNWCYGKKKFENDDGFVEYHLTMAGGGSHWWKYVVRPKKIYILSISLLLLISICTK